MHWVTHARSRDPPCPPDYVTFNKRAAGARITNARDLKFYRREHDIPPLSARTAPASARSRDGSASARKPRDVIPSDVIPGFTYGRKVRPSTPINDVVSYRFAERSEQELEAFYRDSAMQAPSHIRKIPLTAASRGHALRTKQQALLPADGGESLFKLKKFTKATPRIDNGRVQLRGAREMAESSVGSCSRDMREVESNLDVSESMEKAPSASRSDIEQFLGEP